MVEVLLSASPSPDIGQLLVWSPGGWDVLAQFLGYMPEFHISSHGLIKISIKESMHIYCYFCT